MKKFKIVILAEKAFLCIKKYKLWLFSKIFQENSKVILLKEKHRISKHIIKF